MDRIQSALLDAIAYGESGPGKNYDVLYGDSKFSDFSKFPVWAGVHTKWGWTHAAGRYQFEPATWLMTANALGLKDFSPASQDTGAWWLASRVYHHMTGRDLETDLAANHTSQVGDALHSTWTSMSAATFPKRFKYALAKLPAAAPAPAAPPENPSADATTGGTITS